MTVGMMRPLAQLGVAFTLLTRLPVRSHGKVAAGGCVWAFPLVGAVVGGIGAVVIEIGRWAELPPFVVALLALTATILTSGALHEDGLADTADGFGGGRDPARKLAIMRDSRIGTFGALALLGSVMLRAACLAELAEPGWAILAAGIVGRGAIIVPLLRLAPARPDGMAAGLGKMPSGAASIGLLLTAVLGMALAGAAPVVVAGIAALAFSGLARNQIGGMTGDVLGATEQIGEIALLLVLVSQFG